MSSPSLLGGLLTQLLKQSFHQILALHHEMPEVVLLRPRHFSLQRRQVVGQEISQKDGLIV